MKKISTLLLGSFISFAFAQAPATYYDGTAGLTGYALKTKLNQIISDGASDLGYNALWSTYRTADVDRYYENNGSLLDMYSEKPAGPDTYEFRIGSSSSGGNQCGATNNNFEGFCYNREHTLPQSFFGGSGAAPMVNDGHFVVPTDYYVNNRRSNYSYGEVASPTFTSTNGSKLGTNTFPGYGGIVFEPIDEFKGDLARMQLFFVTRYEDKLLDFVSYQSDQNPLDGTINRGYKQWFINLMLKWAVQDPVSLKEMDRNNALYARQGNRNPFIDHPEWVFQIWTSTLSIAETANFSKKISIYPNPVRNGELHLSGYGIAEVKSVQIYSMDGKLLQTSPFNQKNTSKIILKNRDKGIYILKTENQSAKFIVE